MSIKDKLKTFFKTGKDVIVKSIPNLLTIMRIVISVVGARMFIIKNVITATLLLGLGAVTDFLDGFAARKLNATSEFGRKLDAVSDKVYALCLLVPSIICGNLLMMIPLVYEVAIGHINFKGYNLDFNPVTHRIGKFKTAALFPTIIVGLLATLRPEFYFLLAPLLAITTFLQARTLTIYENQFYNNVKKKLENTPNDDCSEEKNNKQKKDKPQKIEKPLNAIGQPKFPFVYKAASYVENNIENLISEGTRYIILPTEMIDDTPVVTAEEKRDLKRRSKTLSK